MVDRCEVCGVEVEDTYACPLCKQKEHSPDLRLQLAWELFKNEWNSSGVKSRTNTYGSVRDCWQAVETFLQADPRLKRSPEDEMLFRKNGVADSKRLNWLEKYADGFVFDIKNKRWAVPVKDARAIEEDGESEIVFSVTKEEWCESLRAAVDFAKDSWVISGEGKTKIEEKPEVEVGEKEGE